MTLETGPGGPKAIVDPACGGRLASLVIGGRERLLQRPAVVPVEPALASGCFLMAPFVGRVRGAAVRWAGQEHELVRNAGKHAIHGTVFDAPWQTIESNGSCLTLRHELDPARWPFAGRMTQHFELTETSLVVAAEVLAAERMPAAIGWHPWFTREPGMSVTVESEATLALDSDLIPTGSFVPVDERTDLRGIAAVDGRRLDDVYVAVRSPLTVRWPDLELRIEFEAPISCAVVFIAAEAVCVEPMTAWPDAIRLEAEGATGTGLATLRAGERLAASTRWIWSPR